jgi:hypothetical protein
MRLRLPVVHCAAIVVVLVWSGVAGAAPGCQGRPATIVGGPRADVLRGTPGPDVIVGGGGADRILGLGGADWICGDSGNDVLLGGSGADFLFGGGGKDSLDGQAGRDFLSGDSGNDREAGGPGNDLFRGSPGNDRYFGGPGEDWTEGNGPGDDVMDGGPGIDLCLEDRVLSCEPLTVGGTLAAGTHRIETFDPRFSVTVPRGWRAGPWGSGGQGLPRIPPGHFVLDRLLENSLAYAVLEFAHPPDRVFDPLSGELVPAPTDLLGWLAEHPAVAAGEQSVSTVGVYSARSMTIELAPPVFPLSPVCVPESCELWRDESFHGLALYAGNPPVRLVLVTVGALDVLITLTTTPELLAQAEAILAGIDFG